MSPSFVANVFSHNGHPCILLVSFSDLSMLYGSRNPLSLLNILPFANFASVLKIREFCFCSDLNAHCSSGVKDSHNCFSRPAKSRYLEFRIRNYPRDKSNPNA